MTEPHGDEFFKSILDQTRDIMVVFSLNGNVLFANRLLLRFMVTRLTNFFTLGFLSCVHPKLGRLLKLTWERR